MESKVLTLSTSTLVNDICNLKDGRRVGKIVCDVPRSIAFNLI